MIYENTAMLFSPTTMSLFCGLIAALMAYFQGKNPFLWFFIGLLFSWLGLIFLYFNPTQKKTKQKQKKDPNTIDITPQIDPSYNKIFWYYLDQQNKQNGPMSFDAITRAFKEGRISNRTYVWNEKLESWKPLQDFI